MCKCRKNENVVYLKIATKKKNDVCKTLGVGSLIDIGKSELAANNGDTLVEAVISVKETNSD
jgi:hypothetical protein